jgi:hypothetical protein
VVHWAAERVLQNRFRVLGANVEDPRRGRKETEIEEG